MAAEMDVYITGMSNTDSIAKALSTYDGPLKFHVDRLNPKVNTPSFNGAQPNPDFFRENMQAKLVAFALWGNWYNTLGLIEHPEKFDFIYPNFDEEVDETRRIIPFTQIKRTFNNNIRYRLRMIDVLLPLSTSKVMMIEVPPPIGDEGHIRMFPGSFREMLPNGVTPPKIRLKLWKLQNEVYADFSRERNIGVLPFPEEAKTADGFMAPEFYHRDPTHANADYGALIISQLEKIHGDL